MSLLLSNFYGHYDFQVITCEISGCFEGSTIVISSCISEMWDILNQFNWSYSQISDENATSPLAYFWKEPPPPLIHSDISPFNSNVVID